MISSSHCVHERNAWWLIVATYIYSSTIPQTAASANQDHFICLSRIDKVVWLRIFYHEKLKCTDIITVASTPPQFAEPVTKKLLRMAHLIGYTLPAVWSEAKKDCYLPWKYGDRPSGINSKFLSIKPGSETGLQVQAYSLLASYELSVNPNRQSMGSATTNLRKVYDVIIVWWICHYLNLKLVVGRANAVDQGICESIFGKV